MKKLLVAALAVLILLAAFSLGDVLGTNDPDPESSFTFEQDDSPPPRSKTADLVERVLPSVVNVRTTQGEGSGVVIDRAGVILTNAHVVGVAETVDVIFNDGREPLQGTVVGTLQENDIAVVNVQADDLTPIAIGRSERLRLGDGVVALGFPLGLGGPTVTSGIVSGLQRSIAPDGGFRLEGLLQTDAAINPGNSGGALVDLSGRLVGINTAAAGAGAAENVGFAIPIDLALPLAADILAGERAWLGVSLEAVDSAAVAAQLGLDPDVRGVLIADVFLDGPAESAGLPEGVVVTGIEQQRIESLVDLIRVVAEHSPGDVVTLEFVGPDGIGSLDVELGLRPDVLPTPEG